MYNFHLKKIQNKIRKSTDNFLCYSFSTEHYHINEFSPSNIQRIIKEGLCSQLVKQHPTACIGVTSNNSEGDTACIC